MTVVGRWVRYVFADWVGWVLRRFARWTETRRRPTGRGWSNE